VCVGGVAILRLVTLAWGFRWFWVLVGGAWVKRNSQAIRATKRSHKVRILIPMTNNSHKSIERQKNSKHQIRTVRESLFAQSTIITSRNARIIDISNELLILAVREFKISTESSK
jgi:hypothetical protein